MKVTIEIDDTDWTAAAKRRSRIYGDAWSNLDAIKESVERLFKPKAITSPT